MIVKDYQVLYIYVYLQFSDVDNMLIVVIIVFFLAIRPARTHLVITIHCGKKGHKKAKKNKPINIMTVFIKDIPSNYT
jgi:hypothetical protein